MAGKKLTDLSDDLKTEVLRIMAMPDAAASVRAFHAFLDEHQIEHVSAFQDDLGRFLLRDQAGELHEPLELMRWH